MGEEHRAHKHRRKLITDWIRCFHRSHTTCGLQLSHVWQVWFWCSPIPSLLAHTLPFCTSPLPPHHKNTKSLAPHTNIVFKNQGLYKMQQLHIVLPHSDHHLGSTTDDWQSRHVSISIWGTQRMLATWVLPGSSETQALLLPEESVTHMLARLHKHVKNSTREQMNHFCGQWQGHQITVLCQDIERKIWDTSHFGVNTIKQHKYKSTARVLCHF